VLCRKWFLVAAWLGALMYGPASALGQQNPTTADEVIANYVTALGGSAKFAAITSFVEKGELSGNLDGFGQPFGRRTLQPEHGTFEFYFKAPNFRFGLLLRDNDAISTLHGCDGTMAWYMGPDAVPHESKAKPGSENECKQSYEPMPLLIRSPNLRVQFKGQKKVADRMAWVVRTEEPKSSSTNTYYFDAKTFLLLRWDIFLPSELGPEFRIHRSYSDYRDVGGIKLAFMVVQQTEGSSLTTILRQVEINAPIDDARFKQPKVFGGPKNPQVLLESPSKNPEVHVESSPRAQPSKVETPAAVTLPEAHVTPDSTDTVTTNFISSSLAELQQLVPELKGLKVVEDQRALPALLDKIGDRTRDLSRKIPNLICHEEIVESRDKAKTTREDFSYLILARLGQHDVTLEEFRVDLKSGAQLESDDARKPGDTTDAASSLAWDNLEHASQRANARAGGGGPLNQGFASMWVRFYPSNRSESTFRYLGQQKIDGHHTLVVAFAQEPGSVRMPGEVRLADKSISVYYQGIAWVDASDFRIVRLRTDLLAPIDDIPLSRLTSEVQFADTQAAGFPASLWLPNTVAVTTQVKGHTFDDKHHYSNYRSFQVHAKILLDP
jgi:hypothetical protein